ncbi:MULTISPECIES: S-methyl-5'-thioinosine phosphorylase [unclassified Wenzhouxiangella]|uniref:S-methyl-5'-thioinosine phosphorylase n=1 Tax=unclassified Wenzhouxiangella TaxID=2613841 RepID=UPI000E326831|nr:MULTISPECIES: S-methyl-5'-thioinosine phosphorylase [unclassified Wenzhouxiangella]RFF28308.1 S-methyl-5'-thioinosine phosphorylase [Wenzhouxiangella sp. 15181]RFP67767.1 S-methyl-5'-thioinosine phosphorylase [Wenzhouxiangella sp. 15190]
MSRVALGIIGGTGALDLFDVREERRVETPYGRPSSALARVRVGELDGWFLARHGRPHRIPPHRINYRANIDALHRLGVERIVAINAVGSMDPVCGAGELVVPDQLIDYSWGRSHSFSDDDISPLRHIEFAEPFAGPTRSALLAAARRSEVACSDGGCLAVTQGPRLETAAEVKRISRDGATLVGMTAMPEAALAREAGMDYASLCIVANAAAGLDDEPISEEAIHQVLASAMGHVRKLFDALDLESPLGDP